VSEDGSPRRLEGLRRRLAGWRRQPGAPGSPATPRRQGDRWGGDTGVPTLDELLNPAPGQAPPSVAQPAGAQPEGAAGADETGTAPDGERAGDEHRDDGERTRFGAPGRPINRGHPFYVGFIGALGVLIAWGLVSLLGQISGVLTLLVVSLFLALGLDPVVEWLTRRGARRGVAIFTVFLGVLAVFAGFISSVIPPVVSQATELVNQLPTYVNDLQDSLNRSEMLSRFNNDYQVTERLQAELEKRLSSGETVTAVFGGIFGAGRAVVSGIFSVVTVLVLTLYFLASLNTIKATAYGLVPATRRERVQLLGDEVTRRIGGFVAGQLSLATINGLATFVVLSILGIPYAAVLAFTVGLLGVIPLVGATLGGVVVVVASLFTSLTSAIIVLVYYVAYQQLENYVLAPRIMARTVSAPGALVLVAALAGGSLLGILGALIAIPLAAGALLIVQEVWMPQQDRK